MTVNAGTPQQVAAAAYPPIPLRRRLYGFGSIYGKTMRDSRLAFIIAAGMFGGMSLVLGKAIAEIFPTELARQQVGALFGSIPAALNRLFANVDLLGSKVGTLGGYVTYKYGMIFALGAGAAGRVSLQADLLSIAAVACAWRRSAAGRLNANRAIAGSRKGMRVSKLTAIDARSTLVRMSSGR